MASLSLDDLAEHLTSASAGRLRDTIAAVGREVADDLQQEAQANVRARLRERSRALLNSIRTQVESGGDFVLLRLSAGGEYQGTSVPYANLQEYGGHIFPVRAKHLAIPIEEGLTARGIPKYASPRQMPFAAFRPVKGAKARWIVFDRRNDQVFFVLVTDALVPEQRYLRDALASVLPSVPGRLAKASAQLVGEA